MTPLLERKRKAKKVAKARKERSDVKVYFKSKKFRN